MGLDIYSGQLLRYYTLDWETIIQKYAKENNLEFEIARKEDIEQISREDALEIIEEWMKSLSKHFKQSVWDEKSILTYETDKPDWDSYGAVLLWAINKKKILKKKTFEKDWNKSSLYKSFLNNKLKYNEFSHLLYDTEIWIPMDFSEPFKWVDPGNNEVTIGSVYQLYNQLIELNKKTWNASDDEIMNWRKTLSPDEKLLNPKAKFGFSILFSLVKFSVDNNLPLKLDY